MILDEFSRISADIDPDILTASMKDQYFGDVDKLRQRFAMQLRKLARRWHVQGSSFSTDFQPVLMKPIDEHRFNVQDRTHWSLWYQLAYNTVMRGDFDYMRHCRRLASFPNRPRTG